MIIGFIIWSICAIIFFFIGAGCWKSEETVGFFTFVKPPVVSDIGRYNHAVAMLWIVSAVFLELFGIPILFVEQNSPVFLIMVFGVVALVIGMMIAYIRIEAKYKV
jgi:membrane-bound ClpP family serine protease